MPVTPSHMRRVKLVDHTIQFDEDTEVTFRFDRNRITDAWMEEWRELEGDGNVSAINRALSDLIHDWDIVNDDGSPFPPTAENIGFLFTIQDKSLIVGELMRATVPARAEGEGSRNTSSSPVTASSSEPANPQNGHALSPLPKPSASLSTK